MTAPTWFWPASGAQARGIALASFGAGIAVADWTEPTLWPFSGSAFGAPIPIGSGSQGFAGAVPDASGGVYAVTWDGTLWHVPSGGTAASTTMPSGQVYVGVAYASGAAFAVAASGEVYISAGSPFAAFPLPARSIVSSGSTIAGCMGASGIATMNAGNGATGFIARPAGMTTLACAAMASGAPLAVAGWSVASYATGYAAGALDPQDTLLMLFVGSGNASLWQAPGQYSDAWSPSGTIAGLANLTSVSWRPDGTQALCASPVSGVMQALEYAAGVLSLQQTLAVAGCCSIAIAGDSIDAVAAQSGLSQAMPLSFAGSTWSTGAAVTGLPGIVAVVPYGASGAVAAVSGALRYLNLTAPGDWTLGGTVPLPFVPTAMTVDTFGQVYAAGSGAVAMASGTTLLASGSWSGAAPTSIAVQQGRVVMAVPGDGLLRVFGLSAAGALSQQSSTPLSLGAAVGLALSSTTLFALGSGSMVPYGFSGSPYALTPVHSGSVAFWNGSSWTATQMGVGHKPTAIGLDASGGAYVATVQNTLWHVASGGTVLSSGTLQTYPGQSQVVPLSVSSILATASGVFAATSIPGVLGQVA